MTTIITPLLVPVENEALSNLLFPLVDDMGTGENTMPRQGPFAL